MTSPSGDPLHPSLPRLADALTEVSSRLREIGDEIRVLQTVPQPVAQPESPPQQQPAQQPPPQPSEQPAQQPAPQPEYQPYPPAYGWTPVPQPQPTFQPGYQAYAPQPTYPQPAPPWGGQPPIAHRTAPAGPSVWERLSREGAGSRLLAWLGGGVTLAGVVLLLVLAVQRGYIGPLPRVLAGVGLGAALVAIGLVLHRRETGRIGGLAVAATGFAVLYLDVVAATSIYRYLPTAGGLLAGLVVAAAGVLVAHRWQSETFAVFVVLACAVSAPVLTRGPDVLLVGFLLVLQIATTPVHVNRRWPGLALAGGVPPIVAVLALTGVGRFADVDSATVLAMCVATGLVQLGAAIVTALRNPGSPVAVSLAASAPAPILLGALLPSHALAAAVLGCAAAVFAAVWVLQRTRVLRVDDTLALVVGAGAAAAGFEAVCLAFAGSAQTLALLGGAIVLGVLGERLRYSGAVVAATVFGAVGLVEMLDRSAPLALLARAPRADVAASVVAAAGTAGVLVTLAVLAIARAADRVLTGSDVETTRLRWIAASTIALYGATAALLAVGLAFSPDEDGFRTGHVLVTVSWTVAAIVMLLRRIDSTPFRVAGLTLVGAAVAKLVLFDLASLGGIPRVIAFLGAGLLLLAAGAKYAAMVTDSSDPADSEAVSV